MSSKPIIIKKRVDSFNKTINVSGDKSISIRWVLFSSLAKGTSKAKNLLISEDVLASLKLIRKLGISYKINENFCAVTASLTSFSVVIAALELIFASISIELENLPAITALSAISD